MWKEIPEPELPSTFPRPELLAPSVEPQWFGLEEPDPFSSWDRYVLRVGNGYAPPHTFVVFTVGRDAGEDGAPIVWPTFPELWAIGAELALEGAILTYPAQVVGTEQPNVGNGSFVIVQQSGAIQGTVAGRRLELAGGTVVGAPPQGLEA